MSLLLIIHAFEIIGIFVEAVSIPIEVVSILIEVVSIPIEVVSILIEAVSILIEAVSILIEAVSILIEVVSILVEAVSILIESNFCYSDREYSSNYAKMSAFSPALVCVHSPNELTEQFVCGDTNEGAEKTTTIFKYFNIQDCFVPELS